MVSHKVKTADKRFACSFDECGRTFTRQEHLQRHVLNHTDGDNTCERCRAHFKRRDLLERHLARHRQKDAEGGALMTRKRMWKDVDGNIVSKKPNVSGQEDATTAAAIGLESAHSIDIDPALMSPPTSLGSSSANMQTDNQNVPRVANDPWVFAPTEIDLMETSFDPIQAADGFWETSVKANQDVRVPQESAPYEDVFNPDTASSFNMPFTTMNNYNWLFDINLNPYQQMDGMEAFGQGRQGRLDTFPDISTANTSGNPLSLSFDDIPGFEQRPAVATSSPEVQRKPAAASPQPVPLRTPVSEVPGDHGIDFSNASSSSHASRASSSRTEVSTEATSVSNGDGQAVRKISDGGTAASEADTERPMTLLDQSTGLPSIDEIARAQILDLIEISQPITPDGHYIATDDPRLSLSSLQTYSDLYFSRFNAAYPLIHQATFEPAQTETLLLAAVLLLGATYCEKDAHQLAVCIHDVLRPQVFANAGFSARPELWVLQTILLVECFGKSRAGQKQHDMSHLFHGLLINLIRRSDCQTIRPETLEEGTGDLEDDWKAWVEAEQRKRLALLCFTWDVQHAVLFCQSLCMSAFELRSTLPCGQSLWEAPSAEQWQRLRKKQKQPPLFLTVLKSYLSAETPPTSRNLNALSRVILFHGLMSVSWDMKRRDQTSLGLMGNDTVLGDWRHRMATAYNAWKADFDAYTMSMAHTLSHASPTVNPEQQQQAKKEFAIFTTSYIAIYHAAHVILYAEFLDLQIYAGARHILGRPVSRADYTRSQKVVKRWAKGDSQAASKAAWHAAHLLKDAVMHLEDFDAGGLLHYPWCLFLATTTIWSFYHARPTVSEAATAADEEDDEMIWDAKAEMNALISSMTSVRSDQLVAAPPGKRKTRTAGLTAVVAKHLSKVRWAVVHEGMIVLKGLVPWRLINQDETLV